MKINGVTVKNLDELAELVDDHMATALWGLYPPPFLHPDSALGMREIKRPFLAWLMSRDIDPLLAGTAAVSTLAAARSPSISVVPSETPPRRRAPIGEVSMGNSPHDLLVESSSIDAPAGSADIRASGRGLRGSSRNR